MILGSLDCLIFKRVSALLYCILPICLELLILIAPGVNILTCYANCSWCLDNTSTLS